ncbi:MAG TPA: cytochrome c/FTR1 family iron permease [Burkholderiales bacterium]|nr:cytochrome c/FTR1 family iron permease [Burkholderiales bacterium]
MTPMRWIFAALLALSTSAFADTSAQTLVHLLDYVGVDYPHFVKDGKVVDAAEYKEQQEFAGQVVDLLGKLPPVPQRAALLQEAVALKALVDAKGDGAEVSRRASALRRQAIDAYQLAVVPRSAPDPQRGAALYAVHCAACHGADGRGDGPAARGLDPAPANFHNRERMSQRSLYGLYNTITLGVAGTSMQPYPQLTEDERWALAFHAGSLGLDPERAAKGRELWAEGRGREDVGTLRELATSTEAEVVAKYGADVGTVFDWLKAHPSDLRADKGSPIALSRRLLAESAATYRAGKLEEAQRLGLASYLEGFELAEAGLDAVDHKLRLEVETQMIAYRDLLRRGAPVDEVERLAGRIDGLLATSADKLGGEALSPTAAAVSAFFILVREGLEALLVVAAIVAFLIKADRREALPWIHAGWMGALVLGVLTWFAAVKLIEVSGATRELTEGVTALVAAVILLYVGFWLHDKSHAQAWRQFIDEHLTAALQKGTLWALAGLSFIAVYREVFETVLFYEALWQQAGPNAHGSVLVGLACGAGALALLAWLILRYGLRLPIGPFFAVCSILMVVLAIAFTGNGIKALQEADLIAASPVAGVSVPLLGLYPTMQTMVAQAVVLLLVAGALVWARNARNRRPSRAP